MQHFILQPQQCGYPPGRGVETGRGRGRGVVGRGCGRQAITLAMAMAKWRCKKMLAALTKGAWQAGCKREGEWGGGRGVAR